MFARREKRVAVLLDPAHVRDEQPCTGTGGSCVRKTQADRHKKTDDITGKGETAPAVATSGETQKRQRCGAESEDGQAGKGISQILNPVQITAHGVTDVSRDQCPGPVDIDHEIHPSARRAGVYEGSEFDQEHEGEALPQKPEEGACRCQEGKVSVLADNTKNAEADERNAEDARSGTQAGGEKQLVVGDKCWAKWHEEADDGKFHYYSARIAEVHDCGGNSEGGRKGLEYTIRWEDPDGYEPTVRLLAEFVRRTKRRPRDRAAPAASRKTLAEEGASGGFILPVQSASGRQVRKVSRFTFSVDEDAESRAALAQVRKWKEEVARPARWVGECEAVVEGRRYYSSAILTGTGVGKAGQLITRGSFVALNPGLTHFRKVGGVLKGRGVEGSKEGAREMMRKGAWIAAVRQLFEAGNGEMCVSCLWFYRPQDCADATIPSDTIEDVELFLSTVTDDNSLGSVLSTCKVVSLDKFRASAAGARSSSGCAEQQNVPHESRVKATEIVQEADGARAMEGCGQDSVEEEMVFVCRRRFDEETNLITDLCDTEVCHGCAACVRGAYTAGVHAHNAESDKCVQRAGGGAKGLGRHRLS
jgi:hypothetical protein